jgi:hypothetical protein
VTDEQNPAKRECHESYGHPLMIENRAKVDRFKELIRFFVSQANNDLEQAKMQCLFIHPHWQDIEGRIQEAIILTNSILEASQKPDADEKYPQS